MLGFSLRRKKEAPADLPVRLSAAEYIESMAAGGYFAPGKSHFEHDPRIWEAYFALCQEWTGFLPETGVELHLGKYGFTCEPHDPERRGLNFALCTHLVDPALPVDSRTLFEDLPALRDSILASSTYTMITDTFSLTNGYPEATAPAMGRIISPVAQLAPKFEAYVEGLSQRRRKNYRRMARDFDDPRFRFDFSNNPLAELEIRFARDQLYSKWGTEDGPYALVQTLWTQACARFRPESCFFMRVYDRDKLVFVQTMLARHGGVYCQSIFKNEGEFYDGIAPYTDFKSIEALCGKDYKFLDPSCRTSLDDPASIGIAKRATVNADVVKPVLAIGNDAANKLQGIDLAAVQGEPL